MNSGGAGLRADFLLQEIPVTTAYGRVPGTLLARARCAYRGYAADSGLSYSEGNEAFESQEKG